MTYMSPPPTPPHHLVNTAQPSPSPAGFRLPAQPTILLKAPSDDTIARLKQLAPYYWSHPQTTNCAIHFPIDPRQQARIQAYQARQRQQQQHTAGSRSRQGSVVDASGRRPSIAGGSPGQASSSASASPSSSVSRQGSSHRLRATHSGSGLSARASILGSSASASDYSATSSSERRGSLTPGYDPFSKGGTSLVVQPSSAGGPSSRRESVPVHHGGAAQLSVPPMMSPPDSLRRGSAPLAGASKNVTPMRTVRLHVEYLTAQSALIRQVLAEAAGYQQQAAPAYTNTNREPFATPAATPTTSTFPHLATPPPEDPSLPSSPTTSTSSTPPNSANPFPHSFFRFSPHRYPRVIHPPKNASSASASGPIIILPVPDPVSFPLLIHYMYHGKMDAIERTLREGQVSWEGLVRNVEYLGLREDVKRYLGKWWKNWRDSGEARSGARATEDDDEDTKYPYPSPMDVDGDADSADVSEWTSTASASAASGELVDEMAGLLGRF